MTFWATFAVAWLLLGLPVAPIAGRMLRASRRSTRRL